MECDDDEDEQESGISELQFTCPHCEDCFDAVQLCEHLEDEHPGEPVAIVCMIGRSGNSTISYWSVAGLSLVWDATDPRHFFARQHQPCGNL